MLRHRRSFNLWQRLGRLAHLRLMIPIRRSRHPAEYTARGVAVGLFWAFTPLIGVQMYLVLISWLLARLRPPYAFSLIVAMAWTWVTNIFTMWPAYYVFYLTGQILLGNWSFDAGYGQFVTTWKAALASSEGGMLQAAFSGIAAVVRQQGTPLLVGCVPYALGTAWLGYRWSLAYLRRRRARLPGNLSEPRDPKAAASIGKTDA